MILQSYCKCFVTITGCKIFYLISLCILSHFLLSYSDPSIFHCEHCLQQNPFLCPVISLWILPPFTSGTISVELWVCMVTYYWLNCMPLKPLLGSSWMTLHCTSLISVKARQWIWDEVLITHLLYVCRSCEPWLQYVGGLFCLKNLFLLFCFFFCLISTDFVCVLDIDLLELAITTWKGNDPGKLVCLIMHTTPRSLDLYYNTVLSSSTSSMFRLSHCLSCAVQIMWFTCTPALTPVLL